MKLSIIVPVYNMAEEQKLNYCLDSLVAQTISDYEIIAVDDASTDSSLQILKAYEQQYPQLFRVICNEKNKRQGGAKNEALKVACGEWIGFIDSDDWITKDYYEKLLKKAEETGADMVGCDYNLVTTHTMEVGKIISNNSMEQTGILDEERYKKLILRPGSMVIKIYKAQVIRENNLNFPEHIFYEDNCAGSVWPLYFTHFEKVEEPMYFYYQHQVSTVHHITQKKCEDRMNAAEQLLLEYQNRGFYDIYHEELEFRFTELYYAITLFSYMQGVKHRKLSFVKNMKKRMQELFPDFEQNKYYQQLMGTEEKKLIHMQMQSDLKFYSYYRLVLAVRKFKKRYGWELTTWKK